MFVRQFTARGFRNLDIEAQVLSPGVNILYGDNAQGKTNCLEALYFCALGRPLRADNIRELVAFGASELDSVRVHGEFSRTNRETVCETHTNNMPPFTIEARIAMQANGKYCKSFTIDQVAVKNTRELFGQVPVVSFAPEDLQLIKAGPSERRRFMDMEICQLSPVYYKELRDYTRALKQRNHALKTIKTVKRVDVDTLHIWDAQLVTHGIRIMRNRAAFIQKLQAFACDIHARITSGAETLSVTYAPHISDAADYAQVLKAEAKRDIFLATTTAGVHKDDIIVEIGGMSVRHFGSQGQQRTACLSLKLAEIAIMRHAMGGITPILLLDDVLSELDGHRQRFLLQEISDLQTIITCTGLEDVLTRSANYNILHVQDGKITS